MRPLRVGEGPQADHAVVRHLAPLGLALGRRRTEEVEAEGKEDYKEELLTVEAPEVKCVALLIVSAQLSPCLGSWRQLQRPCLPQVLAAGACRR